LRTEPAELLHEPVPVGKAGPQLRPGEQPDEFIKALLENRLGHAEILSSEDPSAMSLLELQRRLVELGDEVRYLMEVFLQRNHYVLGKPKGIHTHVTREEHDLLWDVGRTIQAAWRNAEPRAYELATAAKEKAQLAPSQEDVVRMTQEVVDEAEKLRREAAAMLSGSSLNRTRAD
jgi:hypothetical protein